jgi:hypothetical protein
MWYFEVVPKSGGFWTAARNSGPHDNPTLFSPSRSRSHQALRGTGCSLFALAGFGLRVGGWPAPQNLTEENFYDAT